MRRYLAVLFLLTIAALVLGALAFVRSQAAADLLCTEVERRGSESLGGTVTIGKCEVDPFAVELSFREVLAELPQRGVTMSAARVRVRLREIQGLSTMPVVEELELFQPTLTVALPQTEGAGGAAPGTCAPVALPARLLSTRVHEGSVTVGRGETVLAQAVGIDAGARPEGGVQAVTLAVRSGRLTSNGTEEPFELLKAKGRIDLGASRATVESSSVVAGDLLVGFQGSVTDLCSPHLEGTVAASGAFGRILDLLGADTAGYRPVQGRATLIATLDGKVDASQVEGRLEIEGGTMGRFVVGDAQVVGRIDGGVLTVDRLETNGAGGRIALSATVRLDEPGLPVRLEGQASEVSLESLVRALGRPGAWVDARLDAKASLAGTLSPLRLTGPAEVAVDEFVVLRRAVVDGPATPEELYLAVPKGRIETEVVATRDDVTLTATTLTAGSSVLRGGGVFPISRARPMAVSLEVANLALGELTPIGGLPYRGQATGTLDVEGPYRDPHVFGHADVRGGKVAGLDFGVLVGRYDYHGFRIQLDGAHGQRGRTPYALDRFELAMREEPRDFDVQVTVEDGYLEDIITSLEHFHPLAPRFVGLTGRGRGTVRAVGPSQSLDLTLDAAIRDGFLYEQPVARARVKGKLTDRRRYTVEELTLEVGEGGTVAVRGWADIGGALALSVSARDVPASAVWIVDGRWPLTGRASGDLVVEGTWTAPQATGAATLFDGAWAELGLRPVRVGLRLEGGRLEVNGELSGEGVTGGGWVELEAPHAFEASARFDEPELHRWIPVTRPGLEGLAGWKAWATGEGSVRGELTRPGTWSGEARLSALSAVKEDFAISADGPVDLGLVRGAVQVNRLVLAGPASRLSLSGVRARDGILDLTVRGGAEMKLLESFLPRVDRANGVLEVEATVGGTFEGPVLIGSARLEHGAFGMKGFPLVLEDLSGNVAFSQNRIILDDLTGTAGRGRVSLAGEISLRRFLPSTIRMAARLDEVRVDPIDGFTGVVSGQLYADGKPKELYLTGELEMIRGRFVREIEVEELLPRLRRGAATAVHVVDREPWMHMDVGLRAPGTVRVENRNITATLGAELRLTGTDLRPGLMGTVSALDGRAQFRGNEFDVTHAVMDFKDKRRIAPDFDVHAQTEVRDYRIFVHAFGTPETPRVSLTSEPELAEGDLLTLLTLGITARDAEGLKSDDAAMAVMDALFVASGLDRQVRKFIPENPIFKDPVLRLTSGYSPGTGQVEPRFAFEARLFIDELRLRYSAPLSVPGSRTQAEYRITDRVSAQAEWDTERRESALGNLGLDLKLRWELE